MAVCKISELPNAQAVGMVAVTGANGLDVQLKGSAANGGSRNGGNVLLLPGAKSGAGTDGVVIIRKPGGVAGQDEGWIYNDGTDLYITCKNLLGQTVRFTNLGGIHSNAGISTGGSFVTFSFGTTIGAGGITQFVFNADSISFGGTANAMFQNTNAESRRTATQTVTDSTTFAADNKLSSPLLAGRNYRFRVRYFFTTVNTSGVKIDLNGGTATVSAINGFCKIWSSTGTILAAGQISALNTSIGVTATGTFAYVEIDGSMTCTASTGAGTFIPRFAQNAETGAAESVVAQIGSFMELGDVP